METIYTGEQYSKKLPIVNTQSKREVENMLDYIRKEIIDYITPVENQHTINTQYIASLFEKMKKVLL